ncbi:Os12g0211600 [Oryza sativa Japonica Group]|uniref:Os12g0211600 protein n=2 Tax=Oryza sativa subsp. japonica TaxID=39947 RepID=Q0IPE1_ORYSJ|nr:Os12g0211600 [Oryza sativa Japonica Group]BAT16330.1 Os12g0211600 [Oryza sativa Japonica Group]|eukprot:NP_001066405.1 Os12g0211600 [Oryza sativa Japonica Group]
MDPTIWNPDTSSKSKYRKLPNEEGSVPEKPLAPMPNFFRDLRLLMELGIIPVKFVLLTDKFSKLLSCEKFGRLPDMPGFLERSIVLNFLCWKMMGGNHP